MDSIILSFNKEQMKLYKELLQKEHLDLNFDTQLPSLHDIPCDFFDLEIDNIEKEAIQLLKFKKKGFFVSSLTEDEMKIFIPAYYGAIKNINQYTMEMSSKALPFISQINNMEKIIADINKRYADFLPYKAALLDRDEYSHEISKIDEQFNKNIELARNYKKEILDIFDKTNTIYNIVSDFIEKSSKATNEPKFKNFNYNDFFWTVEAFLERIKTVKNN